VERLGKYHRTLEAGLHFLIPLYETISHKVSILERQLDTKRITTITLDNVTISIDIAILYRIKDSSRAIYRVQNIDQAIQTTVIGSVRSTIGKTDLDGVQSNRRELAETLESELDAVTDEWGIVITRVEIIDVEVDADTKAAMAMQLNSERTRRALVREAEGRKESAQLAADADLYVAIKHGEVKKTLADAEAYAIQVISDSIANGGQQAIDFEIKKINAEAIKSIGSSSSSKLLLLPSDVVDSFSNVVAKVISR
jgi:regulator of protease activity HflC (stomatin/prohibitin superfamily)